MAIHIKFDTIHLTVYLYNIYVNKNHDYIREYTSRK